MRVRDWPKEPWENCDGEDCGNPYCEGIYSDGQGVYAAPMLDGVESDRSVRAAAERTVECVNAMRGWSAPEGAVDRLIARAHGALTVLRDDSPWPEKLDLLEQALAEFSRVSEPT